MRVSSLMTKHLATLRVIDPPAVYHDLLEFQSLDIQKHWAKIILCGGVLVWRVVSVCGWMGGDLE